MTARKLSITLHPDIAAAVAASAGQHGESVSARVERALRDSLRREAGLAAVDAWEQEHGAFTPEELAWADAVLDEDFGLRPGAD